MMILVDTGEKLRVREKEGSCRVFIPSFHTASTARMNMRAFRPGDHWKPLSRHWLHPHLANGRPLIGCVPDESLVITTLLIGGVTWECGWVASLVRSFVIILL